MLRGPVGHSFDRLQICQHQLGIDRFDIAERIDAALDVYDVFVLVAADDVQDRIDIAQVAEELISQPFALRRPADQPGDIDQLKNGRDDFLGLDVLIDGREPRIGNRDSADVRLDRAERIVLAGNPRCGERIKERTFSDVW